MNGYYTYTISQIRHVPLHVIVTIIHITLKMIIKLHRSTYSMQLSCACEHDDDGLHGAE